VSERDGSTSPLETPDAETLERWWAGATSDIQRALDSIGAEHLSWSVGLRRRLQRARRAVRRRMARPTVLKIDRRDEEAHLTEAVDGLATRAPTESSKVLVGRRTVQLAVAVVAAIGILIVLSPVNTIIGLIAIVTVIYALVIVERALLFARSLDPNALDLVSDEDARAFPDRDLPVFSVLVPAYREPEVIQHLIRALGALEYPADKLDIKLLLERDDEVTIEAASAVAVNVPIEVVLVPPAEPRTKPKALNYGLRLATGDVVTIYDAEDVPDPLQLRRAAVVFARNGPEVACIQSQLSFSNVDQNIITRWFTLEYAMWFSLFLPGLVAYNAPVPLGGTSNHFRRTALDEVGAWDAFNVTEDADLGIRLHRHRLRTRVVASVTLEEANSDFVNWVKQRSRWYKGYLQTWIVHMRRPVQLWRDLGTRGFVQFNLFVGGTPVLAALNPIFWTLTLLWFTDKPHFIRAIFPGPVFYVGLLCWSVGNFCQMYLWVIATRMTRRRELLLAALLSPLYWAMMSVGVAKALIQLVTTPSYWEKTTHGLYERAKVGRVPVLAGERS
jgi:cellulose synthase/poly-beta-1,6-N-acetylglucosamine synthase-like glycosyltransferase